MFKKKPDEKTEKVTRQVVREITEKRGGVETTTTTITCTKDDFGTAFKKLNLDPMKFQSGGTSITRQIIYTNSEGDKEIMEETVETFDDPKQPSASKSAVSGKSLTEKLGLNFNKSTNPVGSSATASSSDSIPNRNKRDEQKRNFEKECVDKHNEYRRKHCVDNLTLSPEISSYAREWADHLAATEKFQHRQEGKYGENLYTMISSDANVTVTGAEPVDSWYSEIKQYTFGKEPRTLGAGHFTQVIWKSTRRMGVACARSKSGRVIVVANYDPPGNVIGHFAANVPPPRN